MGFIAGEITVVIVVLVYILGALLRIEHRMKGCKGWQDK